jgi:hypothetical protein
MGARRLRLTILVSLCASVALLSLAGGSAQAAVTHEYLPGLSAKLSEGVPAVGPHGESIPVPGLLNSVMSTVFDSGELYVTEPASGLESRIDVFDASSGAFVSQFPPLSSPSLLYQGIAVGHSTGETQVYVGGDEFPEGSPKGVVGAFGSAGDLQRVWEGADAPGGGFGCFECGARASIAVDDNPSSLGDWAAGDVYVTDFEKNVVDVFKPIAGGGEEYVTQLPGGTGVVFSSLQSVTVNPSNGEVLVLDGGAGSPSVYRFRPAAIAGQYELLGTFAPISGQASGIAVDSGDGDIYLWGSSAVDQFDPEGRLLGSLTGAPNGPSGEELAFNTVLSVAVDPASHDLYVTDYKRKEHAPTLVDVFGPDVVIPDVTTAPASAVKAEGEGSIEATLNGTVNPDGAGAATCRFEWGATAEFGRVAPCEPEAVAESASAVAVHATLHGLTPDTTYDYRLQASDSNGTNPGDSSQDRQFTTPGPGVHGEGVSTVRAESATLDAKIDPHGAPTSYYFQYGTSTAYGAEAPVLSETAGHGAALGSGEGDVEASQHLQGLSAATLYHYRVVAVSELAPGDFELFPGADQTFITQTLGLPLPLPDGRAWEMVSPPQKQGALLRSSALQGLIQASAEGDAFFDFATAPIEAEPAGSRLGTDVLFGRSPTGWSAKVVTPPHLKNTEPDSGAGEEYRFFSEDLSKAVVQPFGTFPPLSPEAGEATAYLHSDYLNGDPGELCTSDCYRSLVDSANVPPDIAFGEEPEGRCVVVVCGPLAVGADRDLNHVVLNSPAALTPGSDGGLYEWAAGKLTYLGEGTLGGRGSVRRVANAISEDGSRIVFTGASEGLNGLLLRDVTNGKTVKLDAFQGTEEKSEETHLGSEYMTASGDGSRVFFLDDERLTDDSTAAPNEPDLYEYDLNAAAGSRLTDLSVERNAHADVASVLGVSEDGAYVYFAAAGALAAGAETGGCGSESSSLCNLYVRHDDQTTLLARLSSQDSPDWHSPAGSLTARVSPDGRWLAFMSNRDLTGYDTTDAASKLPDEEVYLYDAAEGRLSCASCNPTGARPTGVETNNSEKLVATGEFQTGTWIAASVPAWVKYGEGLSSYQSRYLSNSGRLFFDSRDVLVPQDVDGTQDVYEYEPAGIGDCGASSATFGERSGGCVAPVSSGTSNQESAFLDASETGSDVFFLTAAKLASQDFDNSLDIYDARACSVGSPCIAPQPVPPPPCDTGESCKPAQSSQPTLFGAPPSATFSGAGNVTRPPAPSSVTPRALTRAQKLARALKSCHRKKRHARRLACERQAKRRYGVKPAKAKHNSSARTGR